ncbi:hypothetical protein [Bacillus thuringiensis]|uniref:hypothetical protein n=1 Tax=Bacillus thuringiensis TaxID=1428 RepID=UPI0015D4E121|nr:hypothetical protein [Bacillus thuringiensis]
MKSKIIDLFNTERIKKIELVFLFLEEFVGQDFIALAILRFKSQSKNICLLIVSY